MVTQMRKLILPATLLVLASVKALSATVDPPKSYDAHIDPDGKVHCINAGNKCTAP